MKYEGYLKRHQFALRILGLWPKPGSRLSVIGYSVYGLTFLSIFCLLFNATEFINFFFIYDELKPFAADLSWFLVHFVTCFKGFMFLVKIKDIQKICSKFTSSGTVFYNHFQNPGHVETEALNSALKKSYGCFFLYYSLSVAVLFNGFIAPLYREDSERSDSNYLSFGHLGSNSSFNDLQFSKKSTNLPYYTYQFCDTEKSPCYEITYTYQIFSTCVLSLVIIHCDNLYIFLVTLCCAELEILGHSIETITHRAERVVRTQVGFGSKGNGKVLARRNYASEAISFCRREKEREELEEEGGEELQLQLREKINQESLRLGTHCVKHHLAILEIFKELEEMYNLLILAQFLSHLIQLCFQMFLVTEVSALSFDGFSMIAFAIAMVIEVYVFCQCGNEIEIESMKLSQAAYNAEWTSSSEPVKKTLLLIMLRSHRPVQFTVGKFAKLSLRTLVLVLKASVSYFMVLRGIQ